MKYAIGTKFLWEEDRYIVATVVDYRGDGYLIEYSDFPPDSAILTGERILDTCTLVNSPLHIRLRRFLETKEEA